MMREYFDTKTENVKSTVQELLGLNDIIKSMILLMSFTVTGLRWKIYLIFNVKKQMQMGIIANFSKSSNTIIGFELG